MADCFGLVCGSYQQDDENGIGSENCERLPVIASNKKTRGMLNPFPEGIPRVVRGFVVVVTMSEGAETNQDDGVCLPTIQPNDCILRVPFLPVFRLR